MDMVVKICGLDDLTLLKNAEEARDKGLIEVGVPIIARNTFPLTSFLSDCRLYVTEGQKPDTAVAYVVGLVVHQPGRDGGQDAFAPISFYKEP